MFRESVRCGAAGGKFLGYMQSRYHHSPHTPNDSERARLRRSGRLASDPGAHAASQAPGTTSTPNRRGRMGHTAPHSHTTSSNYTHDSARTTLTPCAAGAKKILSAVRFSLRGGRNGVSL